MIEEKNNLEQEKGQEQQGLFSFDFQDTYRTVILNWYWFILSLIICIGSAAIYLRYTTPTYQAMAKLLIKDDNGGRRGSQSLQNMSNIGIISNSNGIDNEMEILTSHSLAQEAVLDLKLYVSYSNQGRVKSQIAYHDQALNVDIDPVNLEKINRPIKLIIKRKGNIYNVSGTYYVPTNEENATGPYTLNRDFATLPSRIPTKAGNIMISSNEGRTLMDEQVLDVTILSPKLAANKYVSGLQVVQDSKSTTIARLLQIDEVPQRAIDYLKQLVVVYNRQANEDKNTIALRTEKFINSRLQKINVELGQTEGQIQDYKQRNGMVELKSKATNVVSNQNAAEQELVQIETKIALFNTVAAEIENAAHNLSQVIPANVGTENSGSEMLVSKYNELVLERNRLLRSASDNSPVVEPITAQLLNLNADIRRSVTASRRNLEIQRDAILRQYNKYNAEVQETPQQERMLTQIGRQQEVKSGLYLMLLQKREENNISLAATVDKGKLIDEPQFAGKITPRTTMIMLIGLAIGLGIPSLILFFVRFFRYKIEGHDDVARLTKLPIIADVAIASNAAKGKADIVVHENQNNQMEEVFRSMRTNLQFVLQEKQKVILFTSSTSGEGKTFTAANLAVSFGLLGRKAILVGLDIRRPRLAELFKLKDRKTGITNLLIKETPTQEELRSQILPSGINKNLDLLMAGPVPPNPTELIARKSLEIIFELLRNEYDYILIDTAPVGLVSDTLQISRVADISVYICRADYTPKVTFEMINSLADEKKLPNMSIVLNGIDMSKKKYGYYYGYGRYGKYGRYGSNYGRYGKNRYGGYGSYGSYGYGNYSYSNSKYGNKKDNSIKR